MIMSPSPKFLLLATLALVAVANAGPPLQHKPPNPMRFERVDKGRAEIIESVKSPRYRLPGDVVPVNYNLRIRPVLLDNDAGGVTLFRMPGQVRITVECVRATNVITMHAAELTIIEDSVTVARTDTPDQHIPITRHGYDENNESYEIFLAETLVAETLYDVYIEFEAQIADPNVRMNGIYRSSYMTDGGETRVVATTHFSRTRALRKTFPSFDEPNQKATFEITIGRTDPYHTLSNMNLDRSEPHENLAGWFWDHYHRTEKMPGTVIAFIVSDFDSEVAPPELFHPDKPVAVWGPPPALRDNSAVFAAHHSAKVLRYFEELFGIEYEFPKMDSVGMPDFAAGAMENWGLNIYRTTLMFWYEGINTAANKYSIGDVVVHELAHQWWGNLVTHAWWNDWWLTEGTASYFEYIGFAGVDTDGDFDVVNRVVCDDIQPAMDFDAGPTSVPIHGPISDQFVENPSVINYQKGASVVRMMQGFLGQEAFIGAMSHYLQERRYTAVHQDSFFEELHEYLQENGHLPSNGKTMKEIMDTWTLQPGFPLLRVSRASANSILVSQERFRKQALPQPNDVLYADKLNISSPHPLTSTILELDPNDLWHVPVGYVSASNPDFSGDNLKPKFWVDKNVAIMTHTVNTNQWLVVNGDARGYYRVLYDSYFETLLQAQLQQSHAVVSIASRSQLMDDYFTMAFQRYIRIERALEFTRYLQNEREYVVWVPVFKHLRLLSTLSPSFEDATAAQAFHNYIKTSVSGAFDFLGGTQLPTEAPFRTISRVPLLDWACTAGHEGCIAAAVEYVDTWKTNPVVNPVPVDIQATVYCTAVAQGDAETWTFFLDRYKEPQSGATAGFLNALACSNDLSTLHNILNMAIQAGSDIRPTDAVAAIQRVAMNSEGRRLVLQFLDLEVANIITYTGSINSISSIVSTLSTHIANTLEREQLANFIEAHRTELAPILPTLNGYLTGVIDNNIAWTNTFGLDMIKWIKQFNSPPAAAGIAKKH